MVVKNRFKEVGNGLRLESELKLLTKVGSAYRRLLAAIYYKGGHTTERYSRMTDISLGEAVSTLGILEEEGYIKSEPAGLFAFHLTITPKGKAVLLG